MGYRPNSNQPVIIDDCCAAELSGTATLVNGTVIVANTHVTSNSIILLTLNTPSGTLGVAYSVPTASIIGNTSFVINAVSTAGTVVSTDTSSINYLIN